MVKLIYSEKARKKAFVWLKFPHQFQIGKGWYICIYWFLCDQFLTKIVIQNQAGILVCQIDLIQGGWILKVLRPSQNMWALLVQWMKLKYRNHLGKQGLIERLLISFSVAGLIKQRSLRQTLGKLEKEKFHSLHPSNEGSWSEPIFCTHLKIKLDSLGWLFLREYFRPSRIMKECEF